ncbi:sensor histidine kinase [Frankia sp. AiPa1]|uniref:sensor histidine kinase n=1 Tax=Frankia sp. AiPa1 TaxID=573492 RepID=UPI00202B2C08|nr:sensor histidine kinase [Frankia sp. AiPa1]MCL9760900.1 sensor histidine kinase [Frankia sp. AiPa1]
MNVEAAAHGVSGGRVPAGSVPVGGMPVDGVPVEAANSWQQRSDRIARLLLLPMLVVSTLLSLITLSQLEISRERLILGIALVVIAAGWSVGMLRYPIEGVPARLRRLVFVVHATLGALLVWASPWYGVYAFTGYFFADELGRCGRVHGFVVTAFILAASQTAGYPNGSLVHTVSFLIMAGFNVIAVLSMSTLINRVIDQNVERGRMIDELAETNRRLQDTMGENVGLHAQLLAQAREAGVAEERSRLAGEIHDTLAQGLAGIITQLEAARRCEDAGDLAEQTRHLDLADTLARSNLVEARRSVRALRPEQLDRASLPGALAALARDWTGRTQIQADVVTTGEPTRAPGETESALFRIAQEALANVANHAHATRVRLTLSYLDDTLLLDVADDGRGFHPSDGSPPGRYGLTGMRRRVETLSGTLTIESTPGDGTIVNAAIPLPRSTGEMPIGTDEGVGGVDGVGGMGGVRGVRAVRPREAQA